MWRLGRTSERNEKKAAELSPLSAFPFTVLFVVAQNSGGRGSHSTKNTHKGSE